MWFLPVIALVCVAAMGLIGYLVNEVANAKADKERITEWCNGWQKRAEAAEAKLAVIQSVLTPDKA